MSPSCPRPQMCPHFFKDRKGHCKLRYDVNYNAKSTTLNGKRCKKYWPKWQPPQVVCGIADMCAIHQLLFRLMEVIILTKSQQSTLNKTNHNEAKTTWNRKSRRGWRYKECSKLIQLWTFPLFCNCYKTLLYNYKSMLMW